MFNWKQSRCLPPWVYSGGFQPRSTIINVCCVVNSRSCPYHRSHRYWTTIHAYPILLLDIFPFTPPPHTHIYIYTYIYWELRHYPWQQIFNRGLLPWWTKTKCFMQNKNLVAGFNIPQTMITWGPSSISCAFGAATSWSPLGALDSQTWSNMEKLDDV